MRRLLYLSLAAAALVAGSFWMGSQPEPADQPFSEDVSHDSMAEWLRAIAAETPDRHLYMGSKKARDLRARLASLSKRTPRIERADLLGESAAAELALGNVRRAVAQYEAALKLLSRSPLSRSRRAQWHYAAGLAYLQLAERHNCCYENDENSCIFPIRGGGIHRHKEGATKAAQAFERVTALTQPGTTLHDDAAWLVNICHMTLGSWPRGVPSSLLVSLEGRAADRPFPRFRNVASALGLDAFDLAGGAVVDDFDGDGLLDILTSSWDPTSSLRCYRNVGDGTFCEVTTEVGLTRTLGGLNLLQADYDNDGDVDVLVLRGAWLGRAGRHPNSLLQNDGRGNFRDVAMEAGLASPAYPGQAAAWADYDNDGDLDLYVGNEYLEGMEAPNQLFRNDGQGSFSDVAAAAGVRNRRFTKGVCWGDYDDDGDPDLYVSNFEGENRLYRNAGDGTFEDVAPQLGVTEPYSSFPVWFWDYDNDGDLDIYVPSYAARPKDFLAYYQGRDARFEPSRLFRNDGAGGFRDVAGRAGLIQPVCPMGCNFGDVDGDGWLDIYLGNGDFNFDSLVPNQMFCGTGSRFEDVTVAGGFGHLQKGHGIAFADLDHDGDLDVFSQLGGAIPGDKFRNALYENPGLGNHWLTVVVEGRRSNRSGIGARIHVRVVAADGAVRSIRRRVNSGGSFGANPFRQTIGLGDAARIAFLGIHWPTTGETQRFEDVPLDTAVRAIEDEPSLQSLELPAFRLRSSR